jgi:Uma2 family endonuclease
MSAAPNTIQDNWIRRHRITVDECYRMAEVGLLAADARVELIEGEVIDMAPIGSKHAAIVEALCEALEAVVGRQYKVASQRPVRLDNQTEPQPDVVILNRREDFYFRGLPGAADLLLVVEVSDTTARYDREKKAPLYAQHGIPEMWLIDVNNRRLHCLQEPRDGAYQKVTVVQGGSISPLLLSGASIDLDKILSL